MCVRKKQRQWHLRQKQKQKKEATKMLLLCDDLKILSI